MICTGGSNNCTYKPTDVQCVNATYNGTDGQQKWQISCGDPKMSQDLCFNKVNLTCANVTTISASGGAGAANGTAATICRLEYAIDHVRDSNCSAALTFPQQYVSSNAAAKSGSDGRYWALLIIPIGLAIVGGICWMTGCKNGSSEPKHVNVHDQNIPQYGHDTRAPLYQMDQPYPSGPVAYQSHSESPYQTGGPSAPYPAMPMSQYPTAPYPSANAPPYPSANATPYPTGVQPPYPVAPY